MSDHDELCEALHHLARSIGLVSHHDIQRLDLKLDTIMSQLNDLIAASTTLSTASDALSVKLDALVVASDAVLAALQNADLSPAGEAALATLKASAATAATAGDKVDSEVAKLDKVLPSPAPAA